MKATTRVGSLVIRGSRFTLFRNSSRFGQIEITAKFSSCALASDAKNDFMTAVGPPDRVTSNAETSTSCTGIELLLERDAKDSKRLKSGLYLVGTPIGNLEDITIRALRILRDADIVLAEDTRRSRKLLDFYKITVKIASLHEHNEHGKKEQVLQMLRSGKRVALISDAGKLQQIPCLTFCPAGSLRERSLAFVPGMPLMSDPGALLVQAALDHCIDVFPIPGPSAAVAALVASGLQTSSFLFCGFLPPKSKARGEAIRRIAGTRATLIFFAPVHALSHILQDLVDCLSSERRCVVARELTKVHEEFFRGSLAQAAAEFSTRDAKGEVTIVVEGSSSEVDEVSEEELRERMVELLEEGCSPSSAAKILSKAFNLARNPVYTMALELTKTARSVK